MGFEFQVNYAEKVMKNKTRDQMVAEYKEFGLVYEPETSTQSTEVTTTFSSDSPATLQPISSGRAPTTCQVDDEQVVLHRGNQFRYGFGMVSEWFRYGFGMVSEQFRYGFGMVSVSFRNGFGMVSVWFRYTDPVEDKPKQKPKRRIKVPEKPEWITSKDIAKWGKRPADCDFSSLYVDQSGFPFNFAKWSFEWQEAFRSWRMKRQS
jgi:hypothetical protein